MTKTIEIPNLTERQADWLRSLLSDASAEALGSASNNHVFALGVKTQSESVMFERADDELREYSQILLKIADEI